MKKSIKLFIDSLDVLEELTDEQAGQLFKAIRAYEVDEEEILQGVMKAVFTPFKNNLDRASDAYKAVCEANKRNGAKGGRPNRNKPNGLLPNPNNPKKDKDKDTNKGSTISNLSANKKQELHEYMVMYVAENRIAKVEIDKFLDHWKSATKNATKKDWKAAFRNWCRTEWCTKDDTTGTARSGGVQC